MRHAREPVGIEIPCLQHALLRRIEVNNLYDAREAVRDLADPCDRIRHKAGSIVQS